jgi:triosephosphate isomerase
MRTKYLIANWKMELSVHESVVLTQKIITDLSVDSISTEKTKLILCPSHSALDEVANLVRGSQVMLGAQDVFWKNSGAYTGEVSPEDLKDFGCRFCIVGHSERRRLFNETDEMVNKKAIALLQNNINPIICVGETKEEREEGRQDIVVVAQVRAALAGGELKPNEHQQIIIAYEPVWAIGTGSPVKPSDAANMHQLIHQILLDMYSADVVENCFSIIYGGSVNADNFKSFLEFPIIDGALVGGASLKADEFIRLAKLLAA